MVKKRFDPERVVRKVRQIDARVGEGKSIQQACKEAGITDVTYSARAPDSRTTLAHLSISTLIVAISCSGRLPTGSRL